MTCPRCAVTNPPGTRFCSLCGLRLPSADAQAAAPQPGQFQGYAGTPVPGYPPRRATPARLPAGTPAATSWIRLSRQQGSLPGQEYRQPRPPRNRWRVLMIGLSAAVIVLALVAAMILLRPWDLAAGSRVTPDQLDKTPTLRWQLQNSRVSGMSPDDKIVRRLSDGKVLHRVGPQDDLVGSELVGSEFDARSRSFYELYRKGKSSRAYTIVARSAEDAQLRWRFEYSNVPESIGSSLSITRDSVLVSGADLNGRNLALAVDNGKGGYAVAAHALLRGK